MARSFLLAAVAVVALSLAVGCAAKNTGYLDRDMEAAEMFEERNVLNGYTYYYTGSSVDPEAIIAIKDEWRLKTRLWKKVSPMTEKQLDRWLDNMNRNIRRAVFNKGAVIRGPQGEQIGLWYSSYNWTSIIADPGEKTVMVDPPSEGDPRYNRFGGFGARIRN
ncbi:MAG: hypothetical protein JRI97_00485 [Deltaproteobacteria bacterium]|nr:hypothetical protein [Deltaproteobacteria bacterium]